MFGSYYRTINDFEFSLFFWYYIFVKIEIYVLNSFRIILSAVLIYTSILIVSKSNIVNVLFD